MKGLFFTLGLTYGGAVASLFSPFIGLLVYICFAIIRPEYLWYWSVPKGNYSRTVAVALILGWALHGFGKWKLGRASMIVLAFTAFVVWAMLSALQANNGQVAWEFMEKLFKIYLPFIVGITLIDSVQRLKQLAWVIVASQGYVALELNLSYVTGSADFLVYFREVGFGGMDNNCVAIGMAAGVGFSFFLALASQRWWQKAIALACSLLMAHSIMFAFSRGGMVALALSGLVIFLLLPKRPVYVAAFLLIAVLGIRLMGPQVQQRFQTAFASENNMDTSAKSRLELWSNCLDVASKHPVLGIGPDQWPLIAHEYGWPAGKEAHSLWLQILAELGVVGLFLLLLYYCSCMWRLWPIAHSSAAEFDPWLGDAARMVITGLIGFIISAQFVSLKFLELPYYITLFGAGVLKLTSVPEFVERHAPDAMEVESAEPEAAGLEVPVAV